MKVPFHVLKKLIIVLAFFAITAVQAETITVTTSTTTKTAPGKIWNLQDADILSIINEVSLETGKNFVVDPRVNGKISLISSKPIKPQEVYQVFLSVLQLLGYSAVSAGNVVKIVPNMESTELATRVANSVVPGQGDEVVVRVVPLENVSATQVLPVLRPMLPQWSNISAYVPGNVLILAGHAANLQRILKVIKSIDVASANNIEVIPLHQATATQVATVLNNLQGASRSSGDTTNVSIAADERSNSILLSGTRAARLRFRTLIADLDEPVKTAQGNTDVIYLKYLQAKTLAPVIGKIAQNILRTGGPDPTQVTTTVNASPASSGPGMQKNVKESLAENMTNIQAQPDTNALIITAPPTLMRALKNIVAKLDIRPAQVLVQGIIVELDQNDLKNMGIQWGSIGDNSAPNVGGASASVTFPNLGVGTLGLIPQTQIHAVLSLLQNKSGVNILSTPSVTVLDNHKATLTVGQDVPFQTGSYATTGTNSTATPFNTVESKPVVLQLEVTPQINLGNSVRLQLKLKNDTLQNPDNPTLTPIINTSQIANSVIVNSEDILVLGGLTSNGITVSTDKVPLLGDIPAVGILFQHQHRSLSKKHLVVFIKPTIIYDAKDADCITFTKYTAARHEQIDWPKQIATMGQMKRENILPLWKNDVKLPEPFQK